MIRLTRKLDRRAEPDATLTLTMEQRAKGRLRVTLDDGAEAGIFLERGGSLRDGDCLANEEGFVVRVRAALETISTVCTGDPLLLARACYHLGNRHVALQIEAGRLSYLHDHVLDDMVRGLGLPVTTEKAPFEPESGAYGVSEHNHGHHSH